MYTTIPQPRLLTLALLIGLYGCAAHHRTTHESTTESHTTSDLQRTLHTTHQEHALDTLTLDLTEVVQLLPPSDETHRHPLHRRALQRHACQPILFV